MNLRISLLFLVSIVAFWSPALAEESHGDHHDHQRAEAFKPSNFIIHHIADAHDIHLWGSTHIPLPVILYSAEHGLDVFMSSAFEGHGETRLAERPSGVTYVLSHGHISVHNPSHDHSHGHADHDHHDHAGPNLYDLSITKSIFGMLLMLVLICLLYTSDAADD